MKRFLLYSLSATVALTVGSVARAQQYENRPTGSTYSGTFEQRDQNLTGGIISPDDLSPNNRVIPGTGALVYESEDSAFDRTNRDSDETAPTEGVISPDSQSPNNRAVPGAGALEGGMMDDESPAPTEGIISPDSESPNNRAIPGAEVDAERDDMFNNDESYDTYQEPGYQGSDEAAPTDGIISPDSQSPNNRAVPGAGALEGGMMDEQSPAPTEGIISPDSESPNNRAVPGPGIDSMMDDQEPGVYLDEDTEVDVNEGIISPNSESPVNIQEPDAGAIDSGETTY